MEIHTLKEFIEHFNPKTIQLIYGVHVVNIDTYCVGFYALIRTFENEKYYFKCFNNSNLILDYVG